MFYTEVAALEDVLEEAVYALGTDARTILVQIRKCACGDDDGPSQILQASLLSDAGT